MCGGPRHEQQPGELAVSADRVAIRVWAVVDTRYRPRPIVVEAGANREWIMRDCRERNETQRGRYKVVTCHGSVAKP